MACQKVTDKEKCAGQSGCSESHAHTIFKLKWSCVWPSSANWCNGQWPVLLCTLAG
jgi:hypothetical protein